MPALSRQVSLSVCSFGTAPGLLFEECGCCASLRFISDTDAAGVPPSSTPHPSFFTC